MGEGPRVPFTDLGAMARQVWPEISGELSDTVLGGSYIGGSPVAAFEREWAAYCGAGHAVGVANGTDALLLTLEALGIGTGDEVVLPANTFIATAEAVVRSGAVPRFADVDDATLLLTPGAVEEVLSPRTRAVIAVHLYGQLPDMVALREVTDRAGVLLIEDAAQAHGARWQGRSAGSWGVAGCFSFYPAKNLGAFGDAGAVVTDDAALAGRIRSLGNHGRASGAVHHQHDLLGTNSRLDALQAIALRVKLRRMDEWTAARVRLAERYRVALGGRVRLVAWAPEADHVHHLVVVRIGDRDRVRRELAERGVQTGVHYPVPCHRQPPLRRYARGPLPVAERAAGEILSLPIFPHMTAEQVDAVAAALLEIAGRGVGADAPAR